MRIDILSAVVHHPFLIGFIQVEKCVGKTTFAYFREVYEGIQWSDHGRPNEVQTVPLWIPRQIVTS